jgi:hypothetical protein
MFLPISRICAARDVTDVRTSRNVDVIFKFTIAFYFQVEALEILTAVKTTTFFLEL